MGEFSIASEERVLAIRFERSGDVSTLKDGADDVDGEEEEGRDGDDDVDGRENRRHSVEAFVEKNHFIAQDKGHVLVHCTKYVLVIVLDGRVDSSREKRDADVEGDDAS